MRDSANVRKKGRPKVLDEATFNFLKVQLGYGNYRSTYTGVRAGSAGLALITSCGEAMHIHPKTAKRFPWLMGKKVQMTVLSELHGLPDQAIVAAAEAIEKIHAQRQLNAKQGRKLARLFKGDLLRQIHAKQQGEEKP